MASVRAVGFDYTGVVANLPTGDFFDEMARIASSTRSLVKDAYLRYRRDFQLGHITEEEVWRRVARDLGASDKFDRLWHNAIVRLPKPDVRILDLIDKLRGEGIKVGLLSNLAVPTPWSKDLYESATARHFDVVLLSGEIGYVKPEPEAFLLLAKKLMVKPSELVFVDDRAEALSGINEIGIKPLQYQGVDDLKVSLKQLGLATEAVS